MKRKRNESEGQNYERSKDTTKRHSLDQRLRAFGFRVHARPKGGPDLWIKDSIVYTEQQAFDTMMDQILSTQTE